jgi:carboxyl-terminal processing protease
MKHIPLVFLAFILSAHTLYGQAEYNRRQLLDAALRQLEHNVANPAWLVDSAYTSFKNAVYSDKAIGMTDEEFVDFFNSGAEKLPFTHFYLRKINHKVVISSSDDPEPDLSWKELNPETAYLKINSFGGEASEMEHILSEIGIDTYPYLIIDLIDNQGGSLDAPVVLGQFLSNKPVDVGIFIMRKWFDRYEENPSAEDTVGMPILRDLTYEGISKMFEEEEAFRLVIPRHNRPVYSGKVFVLMNEQTASANEPLLEAFKTGETATLVGTKSSGAMLSAYFFPIGEGFKVFIPIADFQTPEGKRLDKVGVEPDIEIEPSEALQYVLEKLIPAEK